MTYHDATYSTPDEQAKNQNPNDPKAQNRTIKPFVSSHGGISAGGGSSQLERAVYEKHTEFSKQDEDPEAQKKREKEKGVRYFSVFKEETRELEPDPKNPDQPKKVSRIELREEVKEVVEQVGTESFKTVERAAKDPGFENDQKTMGNITFYREAAARASKALWDSTLANLSQRRIFKNGQGSLSEGVPTCEAWAQNESQEINKISDPSEKKDKQEELQKNLKKCQQMTQVSYGSIDPKLEEDSKTGESQLKERGVNYEDPYERDLRNQLEVMNKVGVDTKQLKTNWQYQDQELTNEVLVDSDESGNISSAPMSNAQQLQEYNSALDESIEAFKTLQQNNPDLVFDEKSIQAKKIPIGEKNIMEINKLTDLEKEEFGSTSATPSKAAQNYSELVQEQSGPPQQ